MRFVRVKNMSEATLDGITIDSTVVDGTTKHMTLRDGAGNVLHIEEQYGGLQVSKKAPPQTEKRYAMSACIAGIEVVEHFTDSYSASTRANEVVDAGGEASVEEVTVTLDDDGNVI